MYQCELIKWSLTTCSTVQYISGTSSPVAQSVATRDVNQEVVSSNPSSANSLSDVCQESMWQASFVFQQWAKSICDKAASCLESMLCEKAMNHI